MAKLGFWIDEYDRDHLFVDVTRDRVLADEAIKELVEAEAVRRGFDTSKGRVEICRV
jgi:hypothetical protein